ncbi:MAG: HAD family hydrolase [Polyangiaceae bacterium]
MVALRRPHALLFDLDGTLVDSRGDIAAACNHALACAGRAPLGLEVVTKMVGDGSRTLLARAFDVPKDSPLLETAMADFLAYYIQNPAEFSTFLPGAEACLRGFEGARIALVTNKPRAATMAVLDVMGIAKYFSAVTAGGDGALKPAADPILRVANELAVGPADTWMIGDGPQDIGAAHAAGAGAIAVRGGFLPALRVEAEKPDAWIDSLLDLPALIERASAQT